MLTPRKILTPFYLEDQPIRRMSKGKVMISSEYGNRIRKVLMELNFIFRKIKVYTLSHLGARSIPVNSLAGRRIHIY